MQDPMVGVSLLDLECLTPCHCTCLTRYHLPRAKECHGTVQKCNASTAPSAGEMRSPRRCLLLPLKNIDLYFAGLELDPSSEQFKQGLESAKQAKEGGPMGGGLFGPEFMGRLATSPQTRHLLSQPDFINMIQDLGRNPNSMNKCVFALTGYPCTEPISELVTPCKRF